MLRRAGEYAAVYTRSIPDFTCTQITHRFDDDPSSTRRGRAERAGGLHEGDTITSELTFNNGTESHFVRGVNGKAWSSRRPLDGLTTAGEFREIIGSIFPAVGTATMKWSHWEMDDGRLVAVFEYLLDFAHSKASLVEQSLGLSFQTRVAGKGLVFIDPTSGNIVRVTRQAIIPAHFPVRRCDMVVEYRAVDIGGRPWLCPARSVTISEEMRPKTDIGFFMIRVRSVNQVEFTDYHKFGSESRMIVAGVSPAEEEPAASLVPTTPAQSEPGAKTSAEPRIDVADATLVPRPRASAPALAVPPESVPAFTPAPTAKPMAAPADQQAMFRVRTKVVTVRVVVRDAQGHAIGDLRKDDFELLDNGQPQTISSFSVEVPASTDQKPVPAAQATNESPAATRLSPVPDRYVMYLVDDLDLEFGDLSQTRSAAERVLRDSPDSASRVGVLTTSGRVVLDFTSDWTKVGEALNRTAPQGRAAVHQCPDLSYYLADRIVRFSDAMAIALVTRTAQGCGGAVSGERTAELAAEQAVSQYRAQTQAVVAMLKAAARQMSILLGSRTIVLVSPGFITPDLESEVNGAIDSAARAGVVINTLDARGVWVLPRVRCSRGRHGRSIRQ